MILVHEIIIQLKYAFFLDNNTAQENGNILYLCSILPSAKCPIFIF